MPYDPSRDPWRGVAVSPVGLGRNGGAVTPSDAVDLGRYARIRVFVPTDVTGAAVRVLPVQAADDAPLTLPLPSGQVSILEYVVRRVLETGTTSGLVIHTVE